MNRFIIVGLPRTGSTLLRDSLEQHPRVKVYGELFHPQENQRRDNHYVRRSGTTTVYYSNINEDALQFLRTHVWNDANGAKYAAVGLKIFAERVAGPGTSRLMVRLRDEMSGVRVIHIVRPNMLDSWASRQRARQSGIWRLPAGASSPVNREVSPITPSPEELQQAFDGMARSTEFFRSLKGGASYIEVNYEDLVARYHSEMERVFRFLGVNPVPCRQTLQKQGTEPLRKFLKNYDDLKIFFSGTPYGVFFLE